jgi:hypothetical protein
METLTRAERIDLRKQLLILAKNYFNDEEVVTTCGICLALTKQTNTEHVSSESNECYYLKMDRLLREIFGNSDSLGDYTNSYQAWEGRAYMCLFLAEYLQDTIEHVKCSEILEMVKDRLPIHVKYYGDEGYVSPYICDNVKEVARSFGIGISSAINAAAEICDKIHKLLEGEFSLQSWVIAKGYATTIETYENMEKLQQTRLNFIAYCCR